MEDIQRQFPSFSAKQLSKLCLWYEDEIYHTPGFDPDVNYEMSDLANDDEDEYLEDDER